MPEAINELFSDPTVIRLATAVGGLILVIVLTRLAHAYIGRYMNDPDARYRARKASTILAWMLFLVLMLMLFSDRLGQLTVAFGVAGAGIAFALQEVIMSLAGWLAISFGNFFAVGDRVQLGGTKGDVIDVGLLRTTLMECGEWIGGDNYSGRIVRIANSFVFKEPVYNYSGDFPFLWDEIQLPIRYGSDYDFVRSELLSVAEGIVGEYTQYAQIHWGKMVRRYRIEPARVEPMVTIKATDNWVEFTLRYVVDYKRRRRTKDELFVAILRRLDAAADRVQLASATYEIVGASELNVNLRRADGGA